MCSSRASIAIEKALLCSTTSATLDECTCKGLRNIRFHRGPAGPKKHFTVRWQKWHCTAPNRHNPPWHRGAAAGAAGVQAYCKKIKEETSFGPRPQPGLCRSLTYVSLPGALIRPASHSAKAALAWSTKSGKPF
jgi:hypothetical protein